MINKLKRVAYLEAKIVSNVGSGKYYKRLFDIAVSAMLLLCLLPFFLVIAIFIRLDSRGPVFFKQIRFGRYGKLFILYKFRTMTDFPRQAVDEVMPGNPEVTSVGVILRRFKIDELPQLWNVLRGDMSIVGPRPGIADQLKDLNDVGKKRLLVRPGLTGLAQVHGNIYLPWSERWRYDAEYVEKQSFILDCWILWRTLFVIIGGEKPKQNSRVAESADSNNNGQTR